MPDQADSLRAIMKQDDNLPAEHRVIAVSSGKGGVGKSNLSVNFAIGLQSLRRKPILIDIDMGFANVDILLGVRSKRSLAEVITGADIFDVIQESSSGLPFLAAGNGLLELNSLGPYQIERLLQQLERLSEQFDTVVLDSGAGLGTNLSRILTAADDLLLVTTPEPTAITDAYSLLKLLASKGQVPNTQLIVNRAENLVDARMTAEKLRLVVEKFLGLHPTILGYVLEDEAVKQAVLQQRPLLLSHPNSVAARCIMQLITNYLRTEVSIPRRGMSGFVERIWQMVRPGGGANRSHPA